jgi:hypothetical protein
MTTCHPSGIIPRSFRRGFEAATKRETLGRFLEQVRAFLLTQHFGVHLWKPGGWVYRESESRIVGNMTKRARAHLKKLEAGDSHHLLQVVLREYIAAPEDLNVRISLVGAMHQAGWLRNQIEPYLGDWNVDQSVWVRRGLQRHIASFGGDPLVNAALLFASPEVFFSVASELFPRLVYADTLHAEKVGLCVILSAEWNAPHSDRNFAHRCVEAAWTAHDQRFVEMHYAKVISGSEKTEYLAGACSYSSWSTAHLPYGFWITQGSTQQLSDLEQVHLAIAQLPAWVPRGASTPADKQRA